MKEKNDIRACPKCFSRDVSSDKGYLPGGADAFEFDVSLCNDCGYRGRIFLLVKEQEYEKLKEEKQRKKRK